MWRSSVLLALGAVALAGCGVGSTLRFGESTEPCAPIVLTNGVDDEVALEEAATCLATAIDAGEPFTWDVLQVTTEGDPIPRRIEFDGERFEITDDYRRDSFGNEGVRVETCDSLDLTRGFPVGVECIRSSGDGFDDATLP